MRETQFSYETINQFVSEKRDNRPTGQNSCANRDGKQRETFHLFIDTFAGEIFNIPTLAGMSTKVE